MIEEDTLGRKLVEKGLLAGDKLADAVVAAKEKNISIKELIIQKNLLTKEQIKKIFDKDYLIGGKKE